MQQQIRFCAGADGVRLAYAVSGTGPPLLRAPHWITHLEHDDAVWGHLLDALGRRFTLVRFDQRGCGLSDRSVTEISFEAWVRDVEVVADAADLERFALFGVSQGAAIAIAYAARHPERVSHLILFGGYAQGWVNRDLTARERERFDTLGKLIELGWSGRDASLRQVFTAQFIPGARFLSLESENHLLLAGEPALLKFLDALDEFVPPAKGGAAAFEGLTQREHAILEYVAQGLDNAQIAARLALSEKTVRNYLVAILDKLQVETRAQAIVRAREAGLGKDSR